MYSNRNMSRILKWTVAVCGAILGISLLVLAMYGLNRRNKVFSKLYNKKFGRNSKQSNTAVGFNVKTNMLSNSILNGRISPTGSLSPLGSLSRTGSKSPTGSLPKRISNVESDVIANPSIGKESVSSVELDGPPDIISLKGSTGKIESIDSTFSKDDFVRMIKQQEKNRNAKSLNKELLKQKKAQEKIAVENKRRHDEEFLIKVENRNKEMLRQKQEKADIKRREEELETQKKNEQSNDIKKKINFFEQNQ